VNGFDAYRMHQVEREQTAADLRAADRRAGELCAAVRRRARRAGAAATRVLAVVRRHERREHGDVVAVSAL